MARRADDTPDGYSFAFASAVLVLAASADCLLPAHRASRVDPIPAPREPQSDRVCQYSVFV